jgi:hypothetical protein
MTEAHKEQFKNNRLRHAREVVAKGIQKVGGEQITHFDVEKGEVYYGNSIVGNMTVRSSKHGHLRSVQYMVAVLIFDAIVNQKLTVDEYEALPCTTTDRLLFLKEKGILLLEKPFIDKLIEAYEFAVHTYHLSEKKAIDSKEFTITVDQAVFKRHTETINQFLKLKLKK